MKRNIVDLVPALTDFRDGPRVLANLALDGYLPSRFTLLGERLVTENGILLMGGASLLLFGFPKARRISCSCFTPSTSASPSDCRNSDW